MIERMRNNNPSFTGLTWNAPAKLMKKVAPETMDRLLNNKGLDYVVTAKKKNKVHIAMLDANTGKPFVQGESGMDKLTDRLDRYAEFVRPNYKPNGAGSKLDARA